MHRGFKLSSFPKSESDTTSIKSDYQRTKRAIKNTLDIYLDKNNTLDGGKLQEKWFPQLKADIFISHSHQDESEIISFATWLKECFGLTCFIDSCVWGNYADVLKKIDDQYCRNDNGYDYYKRNYSTSHVHMMLSASLNKMIDQCECLFFIDTPNSIKVSDTIEQKTASPWIYSELLISQLIRKKNISEYRLSNHKGKLFESKLFSEKELEILYSAPTNHLKQLEKKDLETWKIKAWLNKDANPLDVLYTMYTEEDRRKLLMI